MFDFLFQKKNKEMQSMAEIIALDLEKLNLSKLAIEKAVMMIARAIAKSDIIVRTDSKQKSSIEYRLNVMPNDHECGTYFSDKDYKRTAMGTGSAYHPNEWQILQSVCMAGVKQCAVRAHIRQHNARMCRGTVWFIQKIHVIRGDSFTVRQCKDKSVSRVRCESIQQYAQCN